MSGSELGAVGSMKRIKQRRRLVIDRDDHIGDSLGPVFLDQSARHQEEIFARLVEYLGPHVTIIDLELFDERVEVDIELQVHVEESARLASAARDLGNKGARRNAIAMFRQALELNPINPDAATGLGLVLAELEQYPEALMMLRRARESGPENAESPVRAGPRLPQTSTDTECGQIPGTGLQTRPTPFRRTPGAGRTWPPTNRCHAAQSDRGAATVNDNDPQPALARPHL